MSGLLTVFRKEVRENIRDRRALFNSLLLGPLLGKGDRPQPRAGDKADPRSVKRQPAVTLGQQVIQGMKQRRKAFAAELKKLQRELKTTEAL